MSKHNPLFFSPPELPKRKVVFQPRESPDEKIEITFCPLDTIGKYKAAEKGIALVETYITGKNGSLPADFPAIGGKVFKIPQTLLESAAVFAEMQHPNDEKSENVYSAEELVALSITRPSIWADLQIAASEIQEEFDQGNAFEASTVISSVLVSDTTEGTQSSTAE